MVDVSLVGLPKQRVERLISTDTGSSDSDVEYDQPLETLQSIHRRCSIQNKWCIRKVGCNASEMRFSFEDGSGKGDVQDILTFQDILTHCF